MTDSLENTMSPHVLKMISLSCMEAGLAFLFIWVITNMPGKGKPFTGDKAPYFGVLFLVLLPVSLMTSLMAAYQEDDRVMIAYTAFSLGLFFAAFLVRLMRWVFAQRERATAKAVPKA